MKTDLLQFWRRGALKFVDTIIVSSAPESSGRVYDRAATPKIGRLNAV
jgi:hypothetical protein